MSKLPFRPINTDDVSDEALDRFSDDMGVPKLVRPAQKPVDTVRRHAVTPSRQPDSTTSRQPAVTGASEQTKLTVRVPKALNGQMKRDALDRDITVRYIVLSALRAAGYEIADADMEPGAGGSA